MLSRGELRRQMQREGGFCVFAASADGERLDREGLADIAAERGGDFRQGGGLGRAWRVDFTDDGGEGGHGGSGR